jgi:hypothetical protein
MDPGYTPHLVGCVHTSSTPHRWCMVYIPLVGPSRGVGTIYGIAQDGCATHQIWCPNGVHKWTYLDTYCAHEMHECMQQSVHLRCKGVTT